MAFFAVMLPDAIGKPDDLKKTIKDSFVGLPKEAIQSKQAEMAKLGQIVRDAVVSAAVKKGTAIPAVAASAPVVTPAPPVSKKKFNKKEDVQLEWVSVKAKKRAKEEGGVLGVGKTRKRMIGETANKADKVINDYIASIKDFSTTPDIEIEDRLLEAADSIKFEDRALKKTGSSRHRTPRRRSSYRRNTKH
jgi:hypothetical protein